MKKLFWPLFILVATLALLTLLWNGQKDGGSYRTMACVFEDRSPVCLDSISEWREGLNFYDSSLALSKDTLGSLRKLLWEYWTIEFVGAGPASYAKESLLPLQVLKERKSGCMGLSWLAMMVAEARQIPLQVILLPGHVFLKYDCENEGPCVNLEPNRQGYSYTDEEYREKYKNGHWSGFEFKPLTVSQYMGLVAFNIGNLYMDSEPPRALTWYRMAEDFFPEFPGISHNQKIAKKKLPDSL